MSREELREKRKAEEAFLAGAHYAAYLDESCIAEGRAEIAFKNWWPPTKRKLG